MRNEISETRTELLNYEANKKAHKQVGNTQNCKFRDVHNVIFQLDKIRKKNRIESNKRNRSVVDDGQAILNLPELNRFASLGAGDD